MSFKQMCCFLFCDLTLLSDILKRPFCSDGGCVGFVMSDKVEVTKLLLTYRFVCDSVSWKYTVSTSTYCNPTSCAMYLSLT